MPYGIDKDIGGDSKENVAWMEKCVGSVSGKNKRTGKPYTKSEKIAICKAQLGKKKSKAEMDFILDNNLTEEVLQRLHAYKYFLYNTGKVKNEADAIAMVEENLARKNFDVYRLP